MSVLTPEQLAFCTQLRRRLHAAPELSGEEAQTAATIAGVLRELGAPNVVTGLGGHGVAAVYEGPDAGATVLLRCELDALPIQEVSDAPYASQRSGVAHLCGHDGHMAILIGVAQWLRDHPLTRGRVVLLFQPAEEDGSGARAVIGDPNFAPLMPDYAFSLHNMPSLPLGSVGLSSGPMACASRGMKIALKGSPAHASSPETGRSPALAIAALIQAFGTLNAGERPQDAEFMRTAITHSILGVPAFGVTPADAELWVTLRTQCDAMMQALVTQAEALADEQAQAYDLAMNITYHDVFDQTSNDPEATQILLDAVKTCGAPLAQDALPMRASEDFGQFGQQAKSAMLLLGAGRDHPALHNESYDFPETLLPIGVEIFTHVITQQLV